MHLDMPEENLGSWVLLEEDRRCPHRERKEKIGARGVSEVELRDRHRDVIWLQTEGTLTVELRRVDQAAVSLDHGFGLSRRPP